MSEKELKDLWNKALEIEQYLNRKSAENMNLENVEICIEAGDVSERILKDLRAEEKKNDKLRQRKETGNESA